MPIELNDMAGALAARLRKLTGELKDLPHAEAERLRDHLLQHVPVRSGDLRDSIEVAGSKILAAPYAQVSSEGGTIKARRFPFLFVPLRGYQGGPNYVTVMQPQRNRGLVFERNGGPLRALRLRSVNVKGSRWIDKAFKAFQKESLDRLTKRLEAIGVDVHRG